MPASDDSVVQRRGNRDEIEGRASVGHRNAGNGHYIVGFKATISALFVVVLEGRDSTLNDLNLYVRLAGGDIVDNEDQEDGG